MIHDLSLKKNKTEEEENRKVKVNLVQSLQGIIFSKIFTWWNDS